MVRRLKAQALVRRPGAQSLVRRPTAKPPEAGLHVQ